MRRKERRVNRMIIRGGNGRVRRRKEERNVGREGGRKEEAVIQFLVQERGGKGRRLRYEWFQIIFR